MTNLLKTTSILLATIAATLLAIVVAWLIIFTLYVYSITDTSDWFAPTTAPLEVHHNGTGQTVNPQLTQSTNELQGAALWQTQSSN